MGVEIGPGGLIEASRSVRVERVFRWLGRRMFRKDFHAVRAAPGSIEALRDAAAADGPLVVLGNHVSWWDPMLAVLLTDLLMPGRAMVAAMDTDELVRFGVFRRLGVFGIRPKDPDALEPMVGYLQRVFRDEPKSVFWVTPQGEFADVRAKLRLRHRRGAQPAGARGHAGPRGEYGRRVRLRRGTQARAVLPRRPGRSPRAT